MANYQKCDQPVLDMAREILCKYESHKPLLDARVKIDFVFALAPRNERGEPTGDAIRFRGCRALGLARRLKLKDRVMGRGDAEVLLDGDWWQMAPDDEKAALLDHELHHLVPKTSPAGVFLHDDIGRPLIVMRPHDFEFGWFAVIAERHGTASQERHQARLMMDKAGQFFWPGIIA